MQSDPQRKFYLDTYREQLTVMVSVFRELIEYCDVEGVDLINHILAQLGKKARRLCVSKIEKL